MLKPLLKRAGVLPSLPEVYTRVNDLLETESATAMQIGGAVQTDPVLTARILKLINSAYYGLRHPVTSISQIITLLGRQQLQQVLLGSILVGVCKEYDVKEFPMLDFWQHSIKTAIIARQLAMQNAHVVDHEVFFTAGLLHDIGWLVIAKVKPGSYSHITELAETESKDAIQVEAEVFDMTHVEVGVALLEEWGIPALIIECVKQHHEVEHDGTLAIETSIVYLANRLSRIVLSDGEEEGEKTEDEVELEAAEQQEEQELDDEPDQEQVEDLSSVLSTIPNWEKSKCTSEQISIACNLANTQWKEVMELLGMMELENEDALEDYFKLYSV